jgi:hypothetical protein
MEKTIKIIPILIHFIRMVKSPEEISRLARACQLNEDARISFLEHLAPGKTEREMMQHYKEYEDVLNGWVKMFGECPGCVKGGGDPSQAQIRLKPDGTLDLLVGAVDIGQGIEVDITGPEGHGAREKA